MKRTGIRFGSRFGKRSIKGRKRKFENRRLILSSCICVLLCVGVSIIVGGASASLKNSETTVVLKAASAEITQDEQVPELKAHAKLTGKEKGEEILLSKEAEYTVQDFVNDLNKGTGYEITCDADGAKEGDFPVKIKLSGDLKNSLESEWLGKVKLKTEQGTVKVKNKFGDWEGKRFRKNDGTYVKNDFVLSRGKTYYFNEKGNLEKGWKMINGAKYYLNEDGSIKTGWHKEEKGTYYMKEDGTAAIGWLTLGEDRYYFDQNGKMVTGKQKIGVQQCVFAKDGKLKSAKGGADRNKPMIALTFDDGPGPRTGELVETLKKYNARATFFMLGENVGKYEESVQKMLEANCELGNHSYSHTQLTKLDEKQIQNEIQSTNKAIRKASGQPATVLRPPYGAVNDLVKESVGMPMIMWSDDTLDWKFKNAQNTIDSVLKNVQDGDIILMHDIHSSSVDAAIQLIPMLQQRGFQLVTVSELADARDMSLQNGGQYYGFQK